MSEGLDRHASDPRDIELIDHVLAGSIERDSHPWLFDEDVLLFAVRRVEETDPEWLVDRLADRSMTTSGRLAVFAETGAIRAQARVAVRDLTGLPEDES